MTIQSQRSHMTSTQTTTTNHRRLTQQQHTVSPSTSILKWPKLHSRKHSAAQLHWRHSSFHFHNNASIIHSDYATHAYTQTHTHTHTHTTRTHARRTHSLLVIFQRWWFGTRKQLRLLAEYIAQDRRRHCDLSLVSNRKYTIYNPPPPSCWQTSIRKVALIVKQFVRVK